MLPFNDKALESLAQKRKGMSKYFEVQGIWTLVHTGRVIAAVSHFCPKDTDQYYFEGYTKASEHMIAPWLIQREELKMPFKVKVKLEVLTQIYKSLKTWYSARPKGDDFKDDDGNKVIPYAQISFERYDENGRNYRIHLETEGSHTYPALDLLIDSQEIDVPDFYASREFAFNTKEFLDAFVLFAKLRATHGYATFEYSDDPNQPVFISTEWNGHSIITGLPFENAKKEPPKEDKSDEGDSDEESGDEESESDVEDSMEESDDEQDSGESNIIAFRSEAAHVV